MAYGVYARAALNREDYGKASEMAKAAREGYSLMSNADYKTGFCEPTSEWIWGSYNDAAETLYYWSYQVTMAYNGYYASIGYNIAASRELIDAIPDTDMRKGLFLHSGTFLEEGQKMEDVIETTYGSFNLDTEAGMAAAVKANDYAASVCTYAPAQTNYRALRCIKVCRIRHAGYRMHSVYPFFGNVAD